MSQVRSSSARNNVLAIGNAIVDVLARVSDNFLDTHGMPKGGMTLIDGGRAEQLYSEMHDSIEVSGGSAANTAAGIAALGGKVQFIGRVRNDALGNVFARDIRALGVQYDTAPATDGPSTARCLIMVTPDAQRTMCTYLGRALELSESDVNLDDLRASKYLYVTAYLWDTDNQKAAVLRAMKEANRSGAHGAHSYTAEQFGLSADQIRSDYAFYTRRFGFDG